MNLLVTLYCSPHRYCLTLEQTRRYTNIQGDLKVTVESRTDCLHTEHKFTTSITTYGLQILFTVYG